MSAPKDSAFMHDDHRWLHLNPGTEDEVYRLYSGRELVAQTWPESTEKNQQFTLATKDYSSQIWHQQKELSLNIALESGNKHSDQYFLQTLEHGPAKQLPPYLYKEQRGKFTWAVDTRGGKGALLLEYIENEKGEVIVGMTHKDEGGDEPALYVDDLHPTLGQKSYLFEARSLQEAYDHCEEKADQYYVREKGGLLIFPGVSRLRDNQPEIEPTKEIDLDM